MASALQHLAAIGLPEEKVRTKLANKLGVDASSSTISFLDKCNQPSQISQVHAHMMKTGLTSDADALSSLLTVCAIKQIGSLHYAVQVFDEITLPNVYMSNILIHGHACSSHPTGGILLFSDMLNRNIHPNKYTFPFVLKACSEMKFAQVGKVVHGLVFKSGLHDEVFINNALSHLYSSCGNVEHAYQVFLKSPERDVVSWNTMITGYVQSEMPDEALEIFKSMLQEKVRVNDLTMVGVLSACSKQGDLVMGKWVHSYMKRNGIDMNLIICNALLDMYTKCEDIAAAQLLFEGMSERDVISWTSMVLGYAKLGDFVASEKLFNQMPGRDIAAWNALLAAYEQGGLPKVAFARFYELQKTNLMPDSVTFVTMLSACAQLGALDLGRWIHALMRKHGISLNFHLTTQLIHMYSKCGDLDKAINVFLSAKKKDVYVWSAMIAGYAMHGHGNKAINLFQQMEDAGVKPNEVTITNLLCACSHSGLVDVGRRYFDLMHCVYGIKPKVEHYGCMVDILSRAGLLKESVELIETMSIAPHASVWGALLSGCVIHGNIEYGELASTSILEIEPSNDAAYVMLSNIYAKAGKWGEVSRVRKTMREKGLEKEIGCSSIEVQGVIHEFSVGDASHPLSEKIHAQLHEMIRRLRLHGYVPNKSQLLQEIEDDEVRDQALYLHSEKLAIAFGLITTSAPIPIRIVKNLRICGDCHSAAKIISSIYTREILLRDRYRFHHFKGGFCSCNDYW